MSSGTPTFVILYFCLFSVVRCIPKVALLPDLCGTTAARGPGAIIQAHAGVETGVSEYSTPTFACSYVILAATPSQRLRFGFGTGRGEVNFIRENPFCVMNHVTIRDSDGTSILAGPLCGVLPRTDYVSSGDSLTISLDSSGGNGTVLNFTAHYTSFATGANCTSGLFPCTNGRCVDGQGRCDVTLINDCGDFSDNSPGPPGNCSVEPPTTTTSTVTMTQSTTSAVASPASSPDLTWIAYIAGGLAGVFLLYWLLWRPGYLIWRCAGWRHLPCCRQHGFCQKTAPGNSSARWCSCCGQSKVASSVKPATGPGSVTSPPTDMTSFSGGEGGTQGGTTIGGLAPIPESVPGGGLNGAGLGAGIAGGAFGTTMGAAGGTMGSVASSQPPQRLSRISRGEPHIFSRKSTQEPFSGINEDFY